MNGTSRCSGSPAAVSTQPAGPRSPGEKARSPACASLISETMTRSPRSPTSSLNHTSFQPAVLIWSNATEFPNRLWCSRYGRVNYPACTRGFPGRSIRPEVNENRAGGAFSWAAAGEWLLALTRQPLRRLGQPKAAAPDSCIRVASAPGKSADGEGRGGNSGLTEGRRERRSDYDRRSSLVFPELRRVTCGVVVHKVVDNRCDVRTTDGILWTRCGQEKNLK